MIAAMRSSHRSTLDGSRIRARLDSLTGSNWTDLQISKPDFFAVVLQEDGRRELRAKAGDILELAVGDGLHQLRGLQFVFDNLRAVQPMLHVLALHQDAGLIEFADRASTVVARVQLGAGRTFSVEHKV